MKKDNPEAAWADLPIKTLILCSHDFVVFINTFNACDWKTTDKYDEALKPHSDIISSISSRVNHLEQEIDLRISEDKRNGLKELLCDAMGSAFSLSFKIAEQGLDKVESKIASICSKKSRNIQIITAFIIIALEFIILNFLELLKIQIPMLRNHILNQAFYWGSIGAAISIFIRNAKITYSVESEDFTHILESAAKVFSGSIFACAAIVGVKTSLFFPFINKLDFPELAYTTTAFAFGFSEKLIPMLTSPFEKGKIK